MPGPLEGKVYVGDLGSGASKQELEDIFSYYGRLRNVWVARNPPGFAFVEFEDNRDAEDAVRGLDGKNICGRRARVELSNGKSRNRNNRGPPPRRGRPFHPRDRCYECGERAHYARDCNQQRNSRYSSSRSRSIIPRHRRCSYSRSRSPRRSRSRSLNDRNSDISRSVSRERSYSRRSSESHVPRRKNYSRSLSRRRENGSA